MIIYLLEDRKLKSIVTLFHYFTKPLLMKQKISANILKVVLSQPYIDQGLFTFPIKVLTKTIQAMMVNIYFKIYRRATSKKQSNQGIFNRDILQGPCLV